MDCALSLDPETGLLDMSLDGADFAGDDTLKTAVLLSLCTDRMAQEHEVGPGEDRRGWWADAYATPPGDRFGCRWWLLAREKQLPSVVQRARDYAQEALAWMVADGLASAVSVSAFVPRMGWLVIYVTLRVNGVDRRYRFEWNGETQAWRLAGESFGEA
ncbi:bacteriophage protein GP46 [Bordetella ansorpii]|uniref:Bacteriophage protein GP46 n=1 Tax=Bordetella ansorpii TaxID=288768 RepID=A0A157SW46_9BORD|nr:phage GP46 family protein [Bordetella ansorpii]SAI74561.1 bacteriophage protein GP46 [Bordetella ansorpii]